VRSVTEFERHWVRRYPDVEPVGYEMLNAGARCWIRFHSLPGSKRYPETDTDWRELLARQNQLATAVLGADQACWLVQSRWSAPEGVTDIAFQRGNDPFRAIADYGLEPAIVTLRDPATEFEQRWEACAATTTWSPGGFDRLLREIADESAAPTLWFSSDTGGVFAPYAGGVDLFLPDEHTAKDLAKRHPDWLSDHPLGL
jgi:hypothetical protein